MPKGYNKDGSRKVRPVGSGRKAKGNVSISPQITPEAAAVLVSKRKQKVNLNKFISQAILDKAANDATKKATIKSQAEKPTLGQVDLVDMLQEIHLESVVSTVKQQPIEMLTSST